MTEYAWVKTRSFKVSAQAVGQTVESIADEYGVCPPSALVERARRKNSPLHLLFEWNDTVAALRWRDEQARGVIQSIRLIGGSPEEEAAPSFVHVRRITSTGVIEGYVSIRNALADPEMRASTLEEALDSFLALKRRYESIKELAPVWAALETVQ